MTTNQRDTRIDATRTDFIRRYGGNKLNTKINKPKFIISVKLKDTKLFEGSGDSKKKAEQSAAKKLLDTIKLK